MGDEGLHSRRGSPGRPDLSILKALPSLGLFPRSFTHPENVPEVLLKYHLCPQEYQRPLFMELLLDQIESH